MSIAKVYSPLEIEQKWYRFWVENGYFKAKPSHKIPYTVVIPPPNVTGVLHMGHMLNNTIQDILVRRARMQGKEACWVPGTDHASIATEAKVVALLKEQGIDKKNLTREAFLEHAWAWKEKYGGIILEQLKKLGASCDWDRTRFTMEPDLSDAVIDVFIDLYKKGLIYRGIRMVNWDPAGKTALSDEEVNYKEVQSKLYHIRYRIADSNDSLVIATTRPETLLGDTAICVHPEDDRYTHLVGKKAIVPFVDRLIPIIADDYVDPTFGTGCLKVTPAHDLNDYQLGIKHQLPVIDVLNPDGTLSEQASFFIGEDRFVARKKIAKELDAMGLLVEVKDIVNKVGFSERTDAVIEPRISMQWFCKMSEMAKPAIEAVETGEIKLHPAKFQNLYRTWMENVHDWCISRQLWWGQQIPAWYDAQQDVVVAKTVEEALELFKLKGKEYIASQIKQDSDVLDTWFSSWLWPISVFDGFKDPENPDFKFFYPTNDLVTAPEILFFWVARMIMAGYAFKGQAPFQNVYLTGIVRDKLGRKMSKSLGNSPDPIGLIEKYGADGVRVGMLFSSPAGNDLLFDEKLCEQGRNFSNKIWNAFRLIKGWQTDAHLQASEAETAAVVWFENLFQKTMTEIEDHFSKYRMSDALMSVYKLVWDDFCSLYLEMVKPGFEQSISKSTYDATVQIFESILKVLHPFMPFITEELWHELANRSKEEALLISEYPTVKQFDALLLEKADIAFELITQIRNIRSSKQLSPKISLQLKVNTENQSADWNSIQQSFGTIIKKLANIDQLDVASIENAQGSKFVLKGIEFFVPLASLVDVTNEKENLEKELEYTLGFLKQVDQKLSNERFVQNAKQEIVDNEKKKKADAEAKIISLQKALSVL